MYRILEREKNHNGLKYIETIDDRFGNNALWQLIKFNLVSCSVTLLQLLLANILPLFFDKMTKPLPVFLTPVFNPQILFDGPTKYVSSGRVTWGYVLPFFLSNYLANLYGYDRNRKTTFHGKGTRYGLIAYFVILTGLILFSTWLQGMLAARLNATPLAALSRTIAAMAAGFVQVAVLFPLEKFVLFPKK